MSGNHAYDHPTRLWLDFGEDSLRAWGGGVGIEIELEREENGRLTARSREQAIGKMRELVRSAGGSARVQAYCAVGARGVSLRRMKLPRASREETRKLLRLQIEREFPLAPEELAWGVQQLESGGAGDGAEGQEVLVAAVRREVIGEYAAMVRESGAEPVITLGAFARSQLVPGPQSCAMLDLGRGRMELAIIEGGVLESVRVLRRNGGTVAGQGQADGDATGLDEIAELVRARWKGRKLYLTGDGARAPGLHASIERLMGPGGKCEWLDPGAWEGRSATIAGLGQAWERDGAEFPLALEMEPERGGERPGFTVGWRWAALGGLLLVGFLMVRYGEALVSRGRLERRLSEVGAYRDRLPRVEGELEFLRYLKTNQAPYMDVLLAMAEAAPPGTRVEMLTLNRRGELAMRMTLRDPLQVAEFRSKLVQSGWFESVALEEQTVGANRQGVNARFAGKWKNNSP